MAEKPAEMGRANLDDLLERQRRLGDACWISGRVERLDGTTPETARVLVRPDAPAAPGVVLEFSAADVLAVEETAAGSARVAVRDGSAYLIHQAATLRRAPASAAPAFAPMLQPLAGAAPQGTAAPSSVDLGEWVLSQKSHGHSILPGPTGAPQQIDLGAWVASQKSHGHSILPGPTGAPEQIDLGAWVLSQKSHGHAVAPR